MIFAGKVETGMPCAGADDVVEDTEEVERVDDAEAAEDAAEGAGVDEVGAGDDPAADETPELAADEVELFWLDVVLAVPPGVAEGVGRILLR